jgi:hypothetical protein
VHNLGGLWLVRSLRRSRARTVGGITHMRASLPTFDAPTFFGGVHPPRPRPNLTVSFPRVVCPPLRSLWVESWARSKLTGGLGEATIPDGHLSGLESLAPYICISKQATNCIRGL